MQQDQDQKDGKKEVTVELKTASPPKPLAGEDCFCQDKPSPFELAVVASLPLNIWEED